MAAKNTEDEATNYGITVHKFCDNPLRAIQDLYSSGLCKLSIHVDPKLLIHNLDTKPVLTENPKTLRVVCMSDTHSYTDRINFHIPDGDILIHAGDFLYGGGSDRDIKTFNNWLGSLPHKYKIFIAGNHDVHFDIQSDKKLTKKSRTKPKSLITNGIYLQDSGITIEGVKIYGSPWQPIYSHGNFKLERGKELLKKWNLIPNDTDILITHGPPAGHGDLSRRAVRAGCVELLTSVEWRIKPKYHIFGHIHEGYGVTTNGETYFINASTCNSYYEPVNEPIVFDITARESPMKSQSISKIRKGSENSK